MHSHWDHRLYIPTAQIKLTFLHIENVLQTQNLVGLKSEHQTCSLRCCVKNFTDICSIMVAYIETLALIPWVTSRKNLQDRVVTSFPTLFIQYIHSPACDREPFCRHIHHLSASQGFLHSCLASQLTPQCTLGLPPCIQKGNSDHASLQYW